MSKRGGLLAALAVAVGCPSVAGAATVSVQPIGKDQHVVLQAAPGERNKVIVSTDGVNVAVRDRGADLGVGAGCVSVNDHRANCALPGFGRVEARLGNRKDSVRVKGQMLNLSALGGAGADRLIGGPGPDFFDGGAGADVIRGRASVDTVSYLTRTQRVRVRLGDGKRNDGGTADGAKRDLVRGVENVNGGAGSDLLVGDGKDNALWGAGGNDTIRGKGGEDYVIGGVGRDRVFGGKGPDLFPGGAGRDRAFGGAGRDHFQGGSPGNGADLFVGGGGWDTAQYSFGSVRLSLDGVANDGQCADPACSESDEGDNLKGIERLQAPFGDDVLIGSKRDEEFHPSRGADTVLARGGDDIIHSTFDGDPDVFNCGAGDDLLLGDVDAFDMNPNC